MTPLSNRRPSEPKATIQHLRGTQYGASLLPAGNGKQPLQETYLLAMTGPSVLPRGDCGDLHREKAAHERPPEHPSPSPEGCLCAHGLYTPRHPWLASLGYVLC
jgi:hypothetical protein